MELFVPVFSPTSTNCYMASNDRKGCGSGSTPPFKSNYTQLCVNSSDCANLVYSFFLFLSSPIHLLFWKIYSNLFSS